MSKNRRIAWISAVLAGICVIAQIVSAQPAGDFEVLQVRPNFYMIAGAGANIGVQVGDDGVVVTDSGSGEVTDRVLAEIKKLSDKPIRFVINTSADADHVGGNEKISAAGQNLIISPEAETRAAVLAHLNVLVRMSAPTGEKSPYPTDAQPSDTFSGDRHQLFLNGEALETVHQPAAHTDGDSIVFFRRSDVVMAGDILDIRQFPVIDLDKGGSIQGEIDALNNLLDLTVSENPLGFAEGGTMVIPGHGRLCEQADVLEYRDMVTIIRDVIQDMMKKGMTIEQIQAADPTKEYRPRFGSDSGAWTTYKFVEAVYKSLMRKQ
jgi:cyclase